MSDSELCFTPATELAGLIAKKAVSPVEVMSAVLERIDAVEPAVNAFATRTSETAMEQARAAEAAVTRGDDLGPLHGVPMTIKDLIVTEGVATERGSFSHRGTVPDRDAPAVTRLSRAGAISLGKTTTSEFGWKGVSHSPLTGITSNPWQPGFNAGASSAGAGAGAAAGYGPLHIGSDGAGSIRMPAHFCGIFGLKPTFGRIPNWPVPNNDQSSHLGPMTRTVADAALMLQVMAGPHPWDHQCTDSAVPDYGANLDAGVKGLKIAYSADLGHARVDADVAALVADAVKNFESLGCTVEEVTPTFGPDGPDIVRFMWAAHMGVYANLLDKWEEQMDPGLVACIRAGFGHPMETYTAMRGRKLAYVQQVVDFFDEWDLLLTPAVSVAAFPADRLLPEDWPDHEWDWVSWAEFSYPFNFSGGPAASVPCGYTEAGLPVGLQIVGPRLEDERVLQAAAAFESAHPWAAARPPVYRGD
ncbi:MAG: amidase family protein [Alphaproteobacteria bacterium]|jgi:aspartyl-tRNA(Asn)/glutamyl-tRNA(Gln) amidotransferase subunit A